MLELVGQSVSQSGETKSIIARFGFAPEQQEDEYGEEQSECTAHDAGDGTKVLLEVDEYHRVLLGGARGESPQRLASCNKRATRRLGIRLKKKKPSPFSLTRLQQKAFGLREQTVVHEALSHL